MDKRELKKNDLENLDEWIQDNAPQDITTELAAISSMAPDYMIDKTKQIMETLVDYKELMMMYTCAIKEIKTKFDVLNTEFNVRYKRNPISSISSRLKKTSSIMEKLSKKDLPFTLQNLEENIYDVAGVRVICCYVDDIYLVADALLKQDDIKLITRKDYIANPKPNGYRSLHLTVQVPVFFAERKKEMKVEVQIRTIAMDFWASLEHQLKYKQVIQNQEIIVEQLRQCADVITSTDEKMLAIRKQIEQFSDTPTEEEVLMDKLSRIDIKVD